MNEGAVAITEIVPQFDAVQENEVSPLTSSPNADSSVKDAGVRLSDLLRIDSVEIGVQQQISVPAESNEISPDSTIATDTSLGDQILARLDAVGENYKQNVTRAYTALDKSPNENSIVELLKMQLDIAVVSLEVEVVGKGVQKSVQHVETLSKMQ